MIIKCPECGKEISDQAATCPHCGCPAEKWKTQKAAPKAPEKKRGCLTWIVIFVLAAAIFVWVKQGRETSDTVVLRTQNTTQVSAPRPTQDNLTTGQRNALKKAKSYLRVSSFSRSELIKQLEYEGFTHDEAVYGTDHCGADWYEQAVASAAHYLRIMSFSKEGLIKQLEYEGFTHDQAVYGVGKNWDD